MYAYVHVQIVPTHMMFFVSAPKCRDLVLGSYIRVDVRSPKFNHHVHKLKSLPQTKSTYKVYANANLYSAYGG